MFSHAVSVPVMGHCRDGACAGGSGSPGPHCTVDAAVLGVSASGGSSAIQRQENRQGGGRLGHPVLYSERGMLLMPKLWCLKCEGV